MKKGPHFEGGGLVNHHFKLRPPEQSIRFALTKSLVGSKLHEDTFAMYNYLARMMFLLILSSCHGEQHLARTRTASLLASNPST
jgi:hypothetical protein